MMAKHPHNSDRPEPKAVLAAIEDGDIDRLMQVLTPRQRAFAREYVIDFNGSAACIRAGYSKNSSDKQAHLLLRHKGVAYLIDHLSTSKAAAITAVDPDYVIQEVTKIITKENTKDGDKLRGLELLARHLGMFVDRTEITGKDGEAIKHQEVAAEADDFTRKILDIASRKKPNLKVV